MIGEVIDTFRNTTPAVNQKFVRKLKLRHVPIIWSHTGKIDMSIMYFQVTTFCFPIFRNISEKTTQKRKSASQKQAFTRLSDDVKNAGFGQDFKETKHRPISNTHSSSKSECVKITRNTSKIAQKMKSTPICSPLVTQMEITTH